MKKIISIGIASCLLGFTANACAVLDGGYFGFQIGSTNTHDKSATVYPFSPLGGPNLNPPYTATASSTGFGERIYYGYQFNTWAAFEFGFTHYGNAKYTTSGPTVQPAPFNTDPSAAVNSMLSNGQNAPVVVHNGFDLTFKPLYTFESGFGIFGKLGITILRQSESGKLVQANSGQNAAITSMSTNQSNAHTGIRPLIGFGGSYDLSQNWVLDLTYSRVTKGGGVQQADMVALGIAYHFVDKFCGQFLCD